MSLYGPTFHVTPVDLCIIFQCMLYISCILSCGNKIVFFPIVSIVSNCFKIVSNLMMLVSFLLDIELFNGFYQALLNYLSPPSAYIN